MMRAASCFPILELHKISGGKPVPAHIALSWIAAFLLFLPAGVLTAQVEQKPEEKKAAPGPISPGARLASAKTALLRKAGGGNNIAYGVVSSTLEGWGRFTLV